MGKVDDIVGLLKSAVPMISVMVVEFFKRQRDQQEVLKDDALLKLKELQDEQKIRASHAGESADDTIERVLSESAGPKPGK